MAEIIDLKGIRRDGEPSTVSESFATISALPKAKESQGQNLPPAQASEKPRIRMGHRIVIPLSPKSPELYEEVHRMLAERRACEDSD